MSEITQTIENIENRGITTNEDVSPADLGTPPLQLVLTLMFAGFISGLLLVSIFLITKPIIEANKAEALRQAVFKVLPGCKSYRTLELNKEGKLIHIPSNKKAEKGSERIYLGFGEDGNSCGFAILNGEIGFQDVILALVGYLPGEKVIVGFEVLDTKETPGLGDKIIKDKNFVANFIALKVVPDVVPCKPGKKAYTPIINGKPDYSKATNELATITGATISSMAVCRLLSKAMKKWGPLVDAFITEHKGELKLSEFEEKSAKRADPDKATEKQLKKKESK